MSARAVGSRTAKGFVLTVAVVAAFLLLGGLDPSTASIAVVALYFGVAGASFNLLYGNIGILSLAQAIFLAVGGYTGAYFYNAWGLSPWIALLVAPVVAAIVALPVGFAVVMSGRSLIMMSLVTLLFIQAAVPIVSSWGALGKTTGLSIEVDIDASWTSMQFTETSSYAQVLLLLNVVVVGLLWIFPRTRLGRFAHAVRDAPDAAEAVGIPGNLVKVLLFAVSAAVAAPAGVVYAQYNSLVAPDLFLGITATLQVVVVALVGGSARPWGAMVGAVGVVYISHVVSDAAGGRAGIGPLAFAVIFAVVALALPRGISGTWANVVGNRQAATAARAGVMPADEMAGGASVVASLEQMAEKTHPEEAHKR